MVTVTFELPGVSRDKIAIDVFDNRLTISGEVATFFGENCGYIVRERRTGPFVRTLALPANIPVSHKAPVASYMRVLIMRYCGFLILGGIHRSHHGRWCLDRVLPPHSPRRETASRQRCPAQYRIGAGLPSLITSMLLIAQKILVNVGQLLSISYCTAYFVIKMCIGSFAAL